MNQEAGPHQTPKLPATGLGLSRLQTVGCKRLLFESVMFLLQCTDPTATAPRDQLPPLPPGESPEAAKPQAPLQTPAQSLTTLPRAQCRAWSSAPSHWRPSLPDSGFPSSSPDCQAFCCVLCSLVTSCPNPQPGFSALAQYSERASAPEGNSASECPLSPSSVFPLQVLVPKSTLPSSPPRRPNRCRSVYVTWLFPGRAIASAPAGDEGPDLHS